ncbi:MAG: hypothetical protein WB974_15575 [Acidobacteriaceae bacterium]
MTLLRPAWEIWTPETSDDRRAVLAELHKILASPHFCNSKRYPALLEYLVEHALEGRVEQLKERTLGIEVFHRPHDYDTNADTVVRYTAGEVRKRLALYYHENESDCPLQIVLPVGSYVPEFLHAPADEPGRDSPSGGAEPASHHESMPGHAAHPFEETRPIAELHETQAGRPTRRKGLLMLVAGLSVLVAAAAAVLHLRSASTNEVNVVDRFWAPVLHQPGTALLCSGAVVFAPQNYSGVTTANKDNEYPFVSMQIASTIARVSGLLERNQTAYQMQPCTSTPLTELRERPLILLGGYNNEWTMRLVGPLHLTLSPGVVESIVDRQNPQVHWERNPLLPYSSADDYGLIARFYDSTTDSVVMVVAGLGRNGTEAAGLFATSPHDLKLLSDKLEHDIGSGNIEAVVKVNVVDGKTGAPSLESAYRW